MSLRSRWSLLLVCHLALVTPLRAQTPQRVIVAHRIASEVHVDGKLDESVWRQFPPVTEFFQTTPDEGKPTSERTEVRVLYNADKIFFGFWCYDSEPKKIVARWDSHDARTNSDSVDIFLDPFHDRRTGYFFSINARGVQYDALGSETAGKSGFDIYDGTWDGIWESAARVEDWGWTAEVAIPFKTLRVPGAEKQRWGINIGREIVRKNERARWQLVLRFDDVMKPSKSGVLEGIEAIHPGHHLELIPYLSGRVRRGGGDFVPRGNLGTGGLDLRYGLLSNLTAAVTFNPDFADTEADEINITVSRFELFFPEKRKFFNEGANFFESPMDLFFTRRIGSRLPDGEPQRIIAGGKLTGKVGKNSLGILLARTEERTFVDPDTGQPRRAPAATFSVLRWQRDIWEKSSIGFLTVNRDQETNDVSAAERVHAVNLNILKGNHIIWSTQAASNRNPLTTSGGIQRAGFISNFTYNSDLHESHLGYKFLGRGFDVSQIGFEPETDRHSFFASYTYKPFLNRYGIRQFFFEWNYDESNDTHKRLQDAGADFFFTAQLQNFWTLTASYSYDRDRFFAFTPDRQRLDRTRVYIEPRIRASIATNENRPFWLYFQFTNRKMVQFRDNFYGRSQTYDLQLNTKLAGHTKVIFNGQYVREFLLDHRPAQVRRLYITRITHQFTQKWRARILGQFSSDRLGRNWRLNSIVAYDFTARSAFILGYNYQKRRPHLENDLGNELFIKLSYVFDF